MSKIEDCLDCKQGADCRGFVLHDLIIKLFKALQNDQGIESALKELNRQDLHVLSIRSEEARATCWTKSFVLAIARLIVNETKYSNNDAELQIRLDSMIVRMDGLVTKLPQDIRVDLSRMMVEIYNQCCVYMREHNENWTLPAHIVGHACLAISRRAD